MLLTDYFYKPIFYCLFSKAANRIWVCASNTPLLGELQKPKTQTPRPRPPKPTLRQRGSDPLQIAKIQIDMLAMNKGEDMLWVSSFKAWLQEGSGDCEEFTSGERGPLRQPVNHQCPMNSAALSTGNTCYLCSTCSAPPAFVQGSPSRFSYWGN